ncbi:SLC13 family permease [Oryzibacter oryziterrae]|uniref:SLC13 family permease n=1 Tax=Oryzibacter oryziterrae TaxID=2766474 RepID=UPI001EFFAF30|nr:SLC13 family permease [Oryzibacter oryziterrae]
MSKPALPKLPFVVFIACLVAGVAVAIVRPGGLTGAESFTVGAVLVTLSLWGTALVPGYVASMIFFALVLVGGVAKPDLVFSGFASSAVWLIISGAVIGAAIAVSGLGDRLARAMAPALTTSYPRLIGGLMAVSALLGFLMPSSVGRAVVMVPIGMALADRCGLAKGSKGRSGVAAILALGCNMPSFAILTSNIPNMVLSGSAETILGLHLGYMNYLVLHYPILGLVKAVLAVWLVLRLFPDAVRTGAAVVESGAETAKTVDFRQYRVAALLLVTLAFWMTDTLHGVNSAWVGIVAAVLLMLPGIGVVDQQRFKTSVDFGLVLFVAGALALGSVVNASGLGRMMGEGLQALMPLAPGRDFVNFVSLAVISCITGLFTTVPSLPAVLTPLAEQFAAATGFSREAVVMSEVIGFSTVLFPYQVVPLIVAMQLAGERTNHLVRVTLPLAAITFLVLVPLDFLWWKLLGWI